MPAPSGSFISQPTMGHPLWGLAAPQGPSQGVNGICQAPGNLFITLSGPSPGQGEQASCWLLPTEAAPDTRPLQRSPGDPAWATPGRGLQPTAVLSLALACALGWVQAQARGGGFWGNSSCTQIETPGEMQPSPPATCMLGSISVGTSPGGAEAAGLSQADGQRAGSLQLQHSQQPTSPVSGTCFWCCLHGLWPVQMFPLQTQHSSAQPPPDTLPSLVSVPKVTGPRTLASHLTTCRLQCGGV